MIEKKNQVEPSLPWGALDFVHLLHVSCNLSEYCHLQISVVRSDGKREGMAVWGAMASEAFIVWREKYKVAGSRKDGWRCAAGTRRRASCSDTEGTKLGCFRDLAGQPLGTCDLYLQFLHAVSSPALIWHFSHFALTCDGRVQSNVPRGATT